MEYFTKNGIFFLASFFLESRFSGVFAQKPHELKQNKDFLIAKNILHRHLCVFGPDLIHSRSSISFFGELSKRFIQKHEDSKCDCDFKDVDPCILTEKSCFQSIITRVFDEELERFIFYFKTFLIQYVHAKEEKEGKTINVMDKMLTYFTETQEYEGKEYSMVFWRDLQLLSDFNVALLCYPLFNEYPDFIFFRINEKNIEKVNVYNMIAILMQHASVNQLNVKIEFICDVPLFPEEYFCYTDVYKTLDCDLIPDKHEYNGICIVLYKEKLQIQSMDKKNAS